MNQTVPSMYRYLPNRFRIYECQIQCTYRDHCEAYSIESHTIEKSGNSVGDRTIRIGTHV